MLVKYRILETGANSVTVRYWTNELSEDDLAVERHPNGSPKRGPAGAPTRCLTDKVLSLVPPKPSAVDELHDYIRRCGPSLPEWRAIAVQVGKGPVDPLFDVEMLVGQEFMFHEKRQAV